MESKRSLYRPAQVEDNVGQKKTRKTLAQGRLIVCDKPGRGNIPVVHAEAPLHTSHTSSAGNLHTSHVSSAGNMSRLQTSLVQGQLEDSLFSPRRLGPQEPEQISSYSHPAGSLDLSDTDTDTLKSSEGDRYHYQKPAEVLCVDASRQTINPDASEVDIRIGVDNSPVKIVCHSTSPGRFRNLNAENEVERVPVDTMTSHNLTNNHRAAKHRTPVILQEKIAGSHIDPCTAVQSIPMSPPLGQRKILQTLPNNLPQPNFDDSDSSAASSRLGHEVSADFDDTASVASENDVGSAKKSKPRNRLKTSARKDGPATAKKKGKVIPSRYMQAAESKVKTSLQSRIDKTGHDKSKASRSLDTKPNMSMARKTAKLTKSAESRKPVRPHTPENQSIASTGGKTSTPTMDGSLFDIDASAIHPEASLLIGDRSHISTTGGTGKTRSRIQELLGHSVASNYTMNQSTVSVTAPRKKEDPKALQQELNLLWMYNLQWHFLEAKAKKQLKDQEKQAMEQIYGLFEVNQLLEKEKAEKDQRLARLRHANNTDRLAEIQKQCLGPVTNSLSTLEKQYRSLAQALDTTRHQIPTNDIYLPENEEQYQADLEKNLLQSEQLLGEISTITRQDTPDISAMARNMQNIEQAIDSMELELKKNQELLAATESLTMHECSLRVQDMQDTGHYNPEL